MVGNVIEENSSNDISIGKIYSRIFLWMFLGLFATGIVSYFTYNKILIQPELFQKFAPMFFMVGVIELILIIVFSASVRKLSATAVSILYFVYSVINGFTLSTIFVAYDLGTIFTVFFVSSFVYLIFALIGRYTSLDLSKIGTICIIALCACVLITIVNFAVSLIFDNEMDIFYSVIDWIVLILFFGITAYDMQKVSFYINEGVIDESKLHIYCAMELYLDFINIFLRMLRIFGRRKR